MGIKRQRRGIKKVNYPNPIKRLGPYIIKEPGKGISYYVRSLHTQIKYATVGGAIGFEGRPVITPSI